MKKVYAVMGAGLLLAGLNLAGPTGCGGEEEKKPRAAQEEETPRKEKESPPKTPRKTMAREVKPAGERVSRETVVRPKPGERESQRLDIRPATPGDAPPPPPVEVPRATRPMQPTQPFPTAELPPSDPPPAGGLPPGPSSPPTAATPLPGSFPPAPGEEPKAAGKTSTIVTDSLTPFQGYTDDYKRALPSSIERLEDGTISVKIGIDKDKEKDEKGKGVAGGGGEAPAAAAQAAGGKAVTIGSPREPWQSKQTAGAGKNPGATGASATNRGGGAGAPPPPPQVSAASRRPGSSVTIGGTPSSAQAGTQDKPTDTSQSGGSSSVTIGSSASSAQQGTQATTGGTGQSQQETPPSGDGTPPALNTPIQQAPEPVMDSGPTETVPEQEVIFTPQDPKDMPCNGSTPCR